MNILADIIARTREDLEISRLRVPEALLREHALGTEVPFDLASALRSPGPAAPPRIIAELKKASPSKGVIRADFGVVSLARDLARHGAAALSVLTEPRFFRGSPEYLRAAAANVAIPVLRKDFLVDPYQVYEARAWGASAVLLIAAALPPPEFRALHALTDELGLAVLAEVHSADELAWVLDAGARIVGVNSRDLRTFATSIEATAELIARVPASCIAVAESGIRSAADIRLLRAAGAQAFLIGETLMRAARPGEALAELLAGDAPR
jgi:indole-3-glycerol phosphate synthase